LAKKNVGGSTPSQYAPGRNVCGVGSHTGTKARGKGEAWSGKHKKNTQTRESSYKEGMGPDTSPTNRPPPMCRRKSVSGRGKRLQPLKKRRATNRKRGGGAYQKHTKNEKRK